MRLFGLALLLSTVAFGDPKSEPIKPAKVVDVPTKGFSIEVPEGWEAVKGFAGSSVMMQMPKKEGLDYRDNMQVLTFQRPKELNDFVAEEFAEFITKKFSELSSSVRDYRVREPEFVSLADGRDGILFYADFKLEGMKMMHAHVLTSSQTRHYLISYTAPQSRFQDDGAETGLNIAWQAMTSFKADTPAPAGAVEWIKPVAFGLGGGAFFAIVLFLWRKQKEKSTVNRYGDTFEGDLEADVHSNPGSRIESDPGFDYESDPPVTLNEYEDDENDLAI